jgi:LysR family glycine cleavage system transcriptional activator
MRFRDIGGSLQAALNGNGVVLGRSLLVTDAISQQRLVRLVAPGEVRVCSKAQYARWSDPYDHTAARMAAWLVATAKQDLKADATILESTASC